MAGNKTEETHVVWERRQAELWDRIFQVTQDVITVAETLSDTVGYAVVRQELVRAATAVGVELVRANAADSAGEFERHVKEARIRAIESDYWLRLVYVLQQQEDVQRDLSSVISQYTAIITLLQRFLTHTQGEPDVLFRHTKGPRIN
ncbi:MAG: four helix bundle protein [bacterium]